MEQYYTGDYRIGLNMYSLNHNLSAWLNGDATGAPPMNTLQAIEFAKEVGFDAIDITSYYIPGYDNFAMPTKSNEEILDYVSKMKAHCEKLGIEISGTGVKNDFADASVERRTLDIQRIKYWIDIAAVMGAPVMRVFSGLVPADIDQTDWETIARERIAPALRECAEYGAGKGVVIGMQNHGDMASTADQTIHLLNWANHPNLGVVNDIGSYRPFRASNGLGYDWYADIAAILPYTVSFQVKQKLAGLDTDTPTDLEKLLTMIRSSNYRGVIPIEILWSKGEQGHPGMLAGPPYEDTRRFLETVKAAMEYTKTLTS